MNSSPVAHLIPAAAKWLEVEDAERIERIKTPRWIGYPMAKTILAKMDDLLNCPKKHRMPNMLVVGDTNNGKTMLAKRFHILNPSYDNLGGETITAPVLLVQAPPVPDESRFYNSILEMLFAPFNHNTRVDKRQYQVFRLLRKINVKMLIIDELHSVLAGNMNKQRTFLNVIKYLGNELQIPIVGFGTQDAIRALQTDPQLSNRFEPVFLPKWKMNDTFVKLLISFEKMIPLQRPSGLHNQDMASLLMSISDGVIGELATILERSAIKAIETGEERITRTVIDQIKWVSPADRRKQIEHIN